jgi:hypothetical protein
MVTIYTICFNEELIVEFFIEHYRKRFPNCKIIFYDNMSTDNTENIINKHENCTIRKYDTGNKLSNSTYLKIKNHAWKKDNESDWILVCDIDELLDIYEDQLKDEEKNGTTLIKGEGWNMINLNPDEINLTEINHGYRSEGYDKYYLFNKRFIKEINYTAGCHQANPKGTIKKSPNTYLLYHMTDLSLEYKITRYKRNKDRRSDEDKRNGWGVHFSYDESKIKKYFEESLEKAKKLF